MLSVLIKYLSALLETLPYLSEVLGMGDSVEVEGVKTPVYWYNGEPQQLSFDSHSSLVYILKDGDIDRNTIEHPAIANLEQVTETYPLKAIIYYKGVDNVNCDSTIQSIVDGVKKNISGRQIQLESTINAENVVIRVKKTTLNKADVWKGISGSDVTPKEDDNFASIDFDVTIVGDEQCFAGEPCQANDFVYSFPSQSFCSKVSDCEIEPQYLEAYGNGTATITKSELIGREVLSVTTDGRVRSRLKGEFTFTSLTGATVFSSAIQTAQVIQWIYK